VLVVSVYGMAECPTCGRTDFASERGMKTHHAKTHGESLVTVTKECETCEGEFETDKSTIEYGWGQYCSRECRYEGQKNRVELECEQCGDAYTKRKSNAERSRFCSEECLYKNNGESRKDRVVRFCGYCGDVFTPVRSRKQEAQYCSIECHNNAQFDGMEIRECEICGEDVEVLKGTRRHGRGRVYCSNECVGKGNRGKGNGSYNGGSQAFSNNLRAHLGPKSWDRYKREAKERHGNECYMCEEEIKIHIHHIIPLSAGGTNHIDNLIPLCPKCHGKAESYIREMTTPLSEMV